MIRQQVDKTRHILISCYELELLMSFSFTDTWRTNIMTRRRTYTFHMYIWRKLFTEFLGMLFGELWGDLSMEEWLVPQYSQSVCMNAWKWVRVNETFNSWFSGSGRINSVFNVVLFIILIDALSKKLRSACSEEA